MIPQIPLTCIYLIGRDRNRKLGVTRILQVGRIQVFNLILKETVARCLLKEFKGFLFLDTEFPKDLRAIENRKPENSQ